MLPLTVALFSWILLLPMDRAHTDDRPLAASRLEIRDSRLVDLYYWLRHLADPRNDATPDARLTLSVETIRQIDRELGHPLAWGLLETGLATPACSGTKELEEVFDGLPVTFRMLGGKSVPLRALGIRLARTMRSVEPLFEAEIWPVDRKTIRTARTRRLGPLLEHQEACLHDVMEKLGMTDPAERIPVYLVAHSPWPGGFTHRRLDGGGVCFIGLDAFADPSQLWEGILHESTHALDVATSKQDTLLTALRHKLSQAGVKGPLARNIPHTIMFTQAAATVRRLLDPDHRPYGVLSGYYARVGSAGRIVPRAWADYLKGNLSVEAVLDRLVRETRKAASDGAAVPPGRSGAGGAPTTGQP